MSLYELQFNPDAVAREHGETPPPDVSPCPARRIYALGELAALKSAAEDYVVGGGIGTRGGKVLIYAPAGKGKTTFCDYLVAPLAAGRHFLGRFRIDRPYRVGVFQAELVESELASHGQALMNVYAGTPAEANLEFVLDTQLRLPRDRDAIRALIRERGWEVIAFDPILEFFDGESSDKAEQVGKMLTAIDWLIQEERLALAIIVHHQNVAGNRASGSWKFEGWPSTILRLETVPGVATDRMLVFEKIRAPGFGLPEKLQIRLSDEGYLPIAADAPTRTAGELVVAQVLREAGGQLRRQELLERVMVRGHVKARQAAGYVGRAKQSGDVESFEDGRETVYRVASEAAS